MAIDTNALSLGEYAIQSNDPLVQKITFSLHKTANILQDIPLVTRDTMRMKGVRFLGNLPGVTWSTLNTAPTVTKGKPTAFEEQLFLVRNQFQIDRRFKNNEDNIQDPADVQLNAWMEAFAYDFNTKFINNTHNGGTSSNTNAPAGLRYRLDNPATYGTNGEMKISAGALDISSAGLTQANANTLIEYIQSMFDYMNEPDGQDCVLYMNDLMRRKFEKAVRLMGAGAGFTTQKDAFDRSISTYKNAKIRDVGRQVDQITRVIPNTEDVNGNQAGDPGYLTDTKSSIYAVKYGTESFCGWQPEPLKPKDLGLDPTNGVIYNYVIDWGVGLFQPHTRAVARLYNIKVA